MQNNGVARSNNGVQNDLISKSALKKELRKHQIESLIAHNEEKNVFDIINEMPCAYNVERVDEQILDYFKGQIDKEVDGWKVVDFSCDVRNIVRNGGKE